MRILILTFYYEPDLCAGSFRNTALVRTLSESMKADDLVEVVTTAPNRYHSFSASAPEYEEQGNVRIHRIPLPTHKSGLLDQTRAFMSYARGVLGTTNKQSYDLVFASSSRLMTAILGAIVARRKHIPLYLDIRDIFTENISDLFSGSPVKLVCPILEYAEKFAVRSADRINLVSPAFVGHFQNIDASKNYRVFTNGVDFMPEVTSSDESSRLQENKEILYAGNIGQGQGLEKIIPGIARRLDSTWKITIIGDGGGRSKLERAVSGFDNVILEYPVPRTELIDRYRSATALFLHLNDYPALEKVLPSKIFEYAASGKPLIAGVRGQSAAFLREYVNNIAVFPPCDVDGFFQALTTLSLENTSREIFCNRFQRGRIQEEMVTDMLSLVPPERWVSKSSHSKVAEIEEV
jgi:glycosyltransferase involved in cell wall biosynthesis